MGIRIDELELGDFLNWGFWNGNLSERPLRGREVNGNWEGRGRPKEESRNRGEYESATACITVLQGLYALTFLYFEPYWPYLSP